MTSSLTQSLDLSSNGAALSADQEAARGSILAAVRAGKREAVLAGPAGSGKTTLLKQVLRDLEVARCAILCAAPTGKAALRLTELTGRQTKTLHAILYSTCREDTEGGLHFGGLRTLGASRRMVLVVDESMPIRLVDKPHGLT